MATIPKRIFLSFPGTSRRMWFGDRCLAALREVAPVVLNPTERVLSAREIAHVAGDCGVVVLDRLTPMNAEVLDLLPKLTAIVRSGVDIRWIDVAAASERGILVTRVRAGYAPSVSELVLGLMISAARSVTEYAIAYRSGVVPDVLPGQQIAGAAVGIIGYGTIARHLIGILHAMGAKILVFDPYAEVESPATAASLDDLLASSDYVVPLAVATEETRNMLDADTLPKMRRSAWLINCSRGDLVDENALAKLLDEGAIAGAAMDVGWAVDQMPSPALARHPRVIATPHVGGITQQSFESHGLQTADQSRDILAGRIPQGAVNPEHATRMAGAPPA